MGNGRSKLWRERTLETGVGEERFYRQGVAAEKPGCSLTQQRERGHEETGGRKGVGNGEEILACVRESRWMKKIEEKRMKEVKG